MAAYRRVDDLLSPAIWEAFTFLLLLLLQIQADLLKSVTSGGAKTKVVALGIGTGVDQTELRDIASSPEDRNVILVQDFSSLPLVEGQLRDESCRGNLPLTTADYGVIYSFV